MKKINLLVVAVLATGLLWCLDHAVGDADAAGECSCQTVSVRGTINDDGTATLNLPVEASPETNGLPLIRVYQRTSGISWGPADFEIIHGAEILVRGEPGTHVMVVALKH